MNQAELRPLRIRRYTEYVGLEQSGMSVSDLRRATATDYFRLLNDLLTQVCTSIHKSTTFEFIAIQLINHEENIIETVYGTNEADQWCNRARHPLEKNPRLRDIQADIAQTGNIEIIFGWDDRFDQGIFQEHNHRRLSRVFAPIFILKNQIGKYQSCEQNSFDWDVILDSGDEKNHRTALQRKSKDNNGDLQIIGTVEAGYRDLDKIIRISEAQKLFEEISKYALDIYKVSSPYSLLNDLVEEAKLALGADSASLHFFYDSVHEKYIYEVTAGEVARRLLRKIVPRKNGLGLQAIVEQQPKYIPDPNLGFNSVEAYNRDAAEENIQSIVVLPLTSKGSESLSEQLFNVGVLYLHFISERRFTEVDLNNGKIFSDLLASVIREFRNYKHLQSQTRQMQAVHSVAESLAKTPEDGDLLSYIAWNTLNALAADVVTIYEYLEAEKRFLTPPAIAGRLEVENRMRTEIKQQDIPFRLVERGESIYTFKVSNEKLFETPHDLESKKSFSERENIHSVAGILLRVGEETVGTLFINYRRPHHFRPEEKQIIEILASTVAIAIKNQRWLSVLSEVDKEIITTLDQQVLLNLIARKAVQITVADVGEIRLLDFSTQELVMRARYPVSVSIDERWNRTSIDEGGEGVTGWVAVHRQAKIVHDVSTEPIYKRFFNDANSELCVPLLEKDRGLLGVLNVESTRKNAFDGRDQRRLEALSNQVVIALKKVETNEQRVANERSIVLNHIARSLFHRMTNHLGGIKYFAQKLINIGSAQEQEIGYKIRLEGDNALNDLERMRSWLDDLRPVNIYQSILSTLSKTLVHPEIEGDYKIPSELSFVMGNPEQLSDIFYNLIQNSIEAMSGGGKLSITATTLEQEKQQWIIIQITDSGSGIALSDKPRIFDLGYSTKEDHHAGEGLWLAKTYVEKLGGQLTVDNRLEHEGVIATVLLPACSSDSAIS